MAVLMLSVFTVSIGYGVVLPLLPYLIERLLGTDGDALIPVRVWIGSFQILGNDRQFRLRLRLRRA